MRALGPLALGAVVACASPDAKPEPASAPAPVRPSPAPPPSAATSPDEDVTPPEDEALPKYVSPPDAPYRPPPGTPSTPAHVPGPTPEDEKECKARGGKIQAICMLGSFECVIRYRDGGKRCTDKRDCTGECWYEGPRPIPKQAAGVCQRTSDPCGCHARVIGGMVQPTMCLD